MNSRSVIHYCDSMSFGGAEQALLTLLSGLDQERWRMTLAYHASPGVQTLLGAARQQHVALWGIAPMPEGVTGLRRVPGLVAALRHIRPDVFHAHLTWQRSCKYGLLAAALARVPAILATVQLLVELPLTGTERMKSILMSQGVHRYLAVSQATARRLVLEQGIAARRIRVVPNAVRPHQADHMQAEQLRATLAHGRPLVLALARLVAQKGLNTLIDAAALASEACFVIAGEGPLRASLEGQIAALGLHERVRLLGFRHDTAELLEACDMLVLPSHHEGLPLALLEGMAAGRPAIASAIGGNDEAVLHGETGILVAAGDATALARAVRTLVASPELRLRMGEAALKRVRHSFSQTAMVATIASSYEDVLAERVRRA